MARAWTLTSRPNGMPAAGNFALIDLSLPTVEDGMIRVRNRWLSVDPYMRGRMNDTKSYVPPFAIGEPMQGGAVGEIVESRADGFAVGDHVVHMAGWRDEAVLPAAAVQKIPAGDIPVQRYLGHLGMPGMTAWFGLLSVAEAKPGETVLVSAAAGAVGSAVVQIAKAKGMTVVGSAGGAAKVAFVESLGADAAIDYKSDGSLVEKLKVAAPNGIDVYFDNVGGGHLDAALATARDGARFAMCGMIEGYNGADPVQLRYLMRIVAARIRLRGFIVSDFQAEADTFLREMGALVQAGKIRSEETVHDGLEATPEAFMALFSGGNSGKMLVRVA
ncbi:NADP-dependent oxidoreductase [Sphingomonas montana]|uniref:NADP-dependent oxidoreductase n=1 Tax=Sphingomonas montana TaxID=1843236 RepID=UPI00096C494F|nr:NADP-dependent oxidoreductase [Sphingomonas montana]